MAFDAPLYLRKPMGAIGHLLVDSLACAICCVLHKHQENLTTMSSKDAWKNCYSRSNSVGSMSARVYHQATNLLPPSPGIVSHSSAFDFSTKKTQNPTSRQNSAPAKSP